ncbi:MAG TPA: hypothetical protein VMN58_02875 [Acidimicrobiales bacterium]|nr:hypothetical protein [Acidimicrobiales bacterium]
MARDLVHFLLVFDHETGELTEQIDFGGNSEAAVRAYSACEETYRDKARVEVVLIASDSIDTIRSTHSNYFDGTIVHASRFLAGLG